MRSALAIVLFLLAGTAYAVECISCEELEGAPDANILTVLDKENAILEAQAFYENFSTSPSRQPIGNYALLVHLTNATGLDELRRIYTNEGGNATFYFTQWKDGCINFRVIYCPFCSPAYPKCGFEACLDYANIDREEHPETSIDEVELGPGQSVPGTLNPQLFMPALDQTPYCPPPEALPTTPALCLPLFLIFAMLAGSLYVTGRNPFAGFNIGGARVGRHIRYQARGRGYSFSGMAALSAVQSLASAAKTLAKSEEEGGGMKGLVSQEKMAAEQRIFMVGGIKKVARGIKAWTTFSGGELKGDERTKALTQHLEGYTSVWGKGGGEKEGEGGAKATLTGGGMQFLPGGGAIRASELVQWEGPIATQLFGTMARMSLAIASQTTIGSLIDGFAYLTTNKGIFEAVFVDRMQRVENDMAAVAHMMKEGKKGMRLDLGGGHEVVISDVKTDADGNTVFTIKSDKPREGQFGTETRVTVDAEGKITKMSYDIQATPELRQLLGVKYTADMEKPSDYVTVNVSLNKEGELLVSIPEYMMHNLGQDSFKDPVAWDKVTGIAISPAGGLYMGNEAIGKNLLETYKETNKTMQHIAASAGNELGMAMMHTEDDIESLLTKHPKARETLAAMRNTVAMEALTAVFGGDPSDKAPEELQGLEAESESTGMGKKTSPVVTLEKMAEAHGETDIAFVDRDADVSEGEPATFSDRVMVDSGLDDRDKRRVERPLAELLGASSPQELRDMKREDVQTHLTRHFVAGGKEPQQAEAMAKQFVARMDDKMFQRINKAGTEYMGKMEGAVGAATAQKLSQADISHLQGLAGTGKMMSDDSVGAVLANNPGHYTLPPELRALCKEYRAMKDMQQNIGNVQGALASGDISALTMSMQHFTANTNSFIQTRLVNYAAGDPDIPDDRDPKTGTTIVETADSGAEQLYKATKIDNMLAPTSDVFVQRTVKKEKEAREKITKQVQAGNLEQVARVAAEQAQINQNAGNEEAAGVYMGIAQTATAFTLMKPKDKAEMQQQQQLMGSFAKTTQDSLKTLPSADVVGRRNASVSTEASTEMHRRDSVAALTASGDYGSAIHAAYQSYKHHKDMGNEEMAKRYGQAIKGISIIRDTYKKAKAKGQELGMGEATALMYNVTGPLGAGPSEEPVVWEEKGAVVAEVKGQRQIDPLSLARSTLDRRNQNLGMGSQKLSDAKERHEALTGERSRLRPKKKEE